MSKMILTFAAVLRPHDLPPMWKYWSRLKRAYARGQQTTNLFSVRYDQFLDSPVVSLREALKLPPLEG